MLITLGSKLLHILSYVKSAFAIPDSNRLLVTQEDTWAMGVLVYGGPSGLTCSCMSVSFPV